MRFDSSFDDERAHGFDYAAVERLAFVRFILQDVIFGVGCAYGGYYSSWLFVS
jgi:hypothetical protein